MKTGTLIILILGISLLLGGWVSNYASSNPDGLEWVAGEQGFLEAGEVEPAYNAAPMPDYDSPHMPSSLSTLISGAGGTLLVFGLGLGFGRIIQKRKSIS